MKRRGFTLLELMIVASIVVVATPATYAIWRLREGERHTTLFIVDAASGARSIADELRRDLRTMQWDAAGTTLTGAGTCPKLEYTIVDGVLVRRGEGCGPERMLARHVEAFERTSDGVHVTFALKLSPAETRRRTYDLRIPGGLDASK